MMEIGDMQRTDSWSELLIHLRLSLCIGRRFEEGWQEESASRSLICTEYSSNHKEAGSE